MAKFLISYDVNKENEGDELINYLENELEARRIQFSLWYLVIEGESASELFHHLKTKISKGDSLLVVKIVNWKQTHGNLDFENCSKDYWKT